jgi:hypothetical protein
MLERNGGRRMVASVVAGFALAAMTAAGQTVRSLAIEIVVPGLTIDEGTAVVLDAATFREGGPLRKLDGSPIGTPALEEGVPIRNGAAIVNASAPVEGYMILPRLLVTHRGTEKAVSFTPPVTFRITRESLEKGRLRVDLPASVLVDVQVVDGRGAPVPNGVVSVLGGEMDESASVTTNDAGSATILLPRGAYRCRRQGDRSSTVPLDVRGDESAPLQIRLRSERPQ